mmetsp:Transcript_31657/g.37115  ORF Transcript_31657/g.37115 Transcript_31657/m.37115 type:complete len:189 (+) Transcript_31657:19-585(+)|eukprot:CAMPEP_0185578168 /NCGR_PEP_ID=MMETSP0434-20130131/12184_1 /TAXON_ID=626734 ORGANISM="Favella taraikaensis, Strain Fe Narragansett Bay" /NCGR_SAMPLE_ID=MMETSP0434 /ASSEMBLY_ACC=CAM_ASM_000379 /LENGTH=188 /DNA_ID=CAMNT_0028195919 /DNA_START=20 /DNA_END=586 /DNA_ORIENTATION=+
MVKYTFSPADESTAAKSSGRSLRVHFKHCREVGHFIKGMPLAEAKKYLQDVLEYKRAIPFVRFTGGCGRHAQGKIIKAPGNSARWPQKATKHFLHLLQNAESNAEAKSLDTDSLVVSHVQCNRAPKMRRRTYRAHGRINAYMASPAHIELILTNKPEPVAKPDTRPPVRKTRKQLAKMRLKSGGGVSA